MKSSSTQEDKAVSQEQAEELVGLYVRLHLRLEEVWQSFRSLMLPAAFAIQAGYQYSREPERHQYIDEEWPSREIALDHILEIRGISKELHNLRQAMPRAYQNTLTPPAVVGDGCSCPIANWLFWGERRAVLDLHPAPVVTTPPPPSSPLPPSTAAAAPDIVTPPASFRAAYLAWIQENCPRQGTACPLPAANRSSPPFSASATTNLQQVKDTSDSQQTKDNKTEDSKPFLPGQHVCWLDKKGVIQHLCFGYVLCLSSEEQYFWVKQEDLNHLGFEAGDRVTWISQPSGQMIAGVVRYTNAEKTAAYCCGKNIAGREYSGWLQTADLEHV